MTTVIVNGPQAVDPQAIDHERLYAGQIEQQSGLGTAPVCKPEILHAVGKSAEQFRADVNARKIAKRRKAQSALGNLAELDAVVEAAESRYRQAVDSLAAARDKEPWKTDHLQQQANVSQSDVTSAREKRLRREYDAREVLDRTADPAIAGTLWYLSRLKQSIGETNSGRVADDGYVPPRIVPVMKSSFPPIVAAIDEQIASLQELQHDPERGIAQ